MHSIPRRLRTGSWRLRARVLTAGAASAACVLAAVLATGCDDTAEAGGSCATSEDCSAGVCVDYTCHTIGRCSPACAPGRVCVEGLCQVESGAEPADASFRPPVDAESTEDAADASASDSGSTLDSATDTGTPTAPCGDGTCDVGAGETCTSCAPDCGACACGDGSCNGTETCTSCGMDCGTCPPRCPDGTCDVGAGETCTSCVLDCGACVEVCGNGTCGSSETCSACPSDCGACPPAPPTPVSITVRNSAGVAIGGASVRVYNPSFDQTRSTSSSGATSFSLASGVVHNITVTKAGYTTVNQTINPTPPSESRMITMTATAPPPPVAPAAPTSITATVGLVGRVSVGWSSVSGAQTYQAFRCTSSAYSSCTSITLWQGPTTTNDTGATPGTTYYYRAKARNCASGVCTESAFSAYQHGSVAAAPAAPTGVIASGGAVEYVYFHWSPVSGAQTYRAYRCTSTSTSTCSGISNFGVATYFYDRTASPGVTYHYRAKARACDSGFCTESAYSAADSGHRASPSP